MTAAEAETYEKEGVGEQIAIQARMQAAAEARIGTAIDPEQLSQLNSDIDVIKGQIQDQLNATGVYTGQKADLFAQITAQRYATRAVRIAEETGQPVDAMRLFVADRLQIVGDAAVQAAQGFTQTGLATRDDFTAANDANMDMAGVNQIGGMEANTGRNAGPAFIVEAIELENGRTLFIERDEDADSINQLHAEDIASLIDMGAIPEQFRKFAEPAADLDQDTGRRAPAKEGFDAVRSVRGENVTGDVPWTVWKVNPNLDDTLEQFGGTRFFNKTEGAFPSEDIPDLEGFNKFLDEAEGLGFDRGIIADLSPDDIVDSAGLYDSPELTQLLWDNVLEPNNITKIRTKDWSTTSMLLCSPPAGTSSLVVGLTRRPASIISMPALYLIIKQMRCMLHQHLIN
jgi:hypothetical protein